jgi:DNA-binding transcriptional LysR family regulator
VHRALHSLEQGVRCALFRHEGRNLKSTEAAQMLAEVAQEVLTLMSDGIRATREAAGYSSDRLKIGSLYSLTIQTVPGIVVDLKVRRPTLQVELVLGSNAESRRPQTRPMRIRKRSTCGIAATRHSYRSARVSSLFMAFGTRFASRTSRRT